MPAPPLSRILLAGDPAPPDVQPALEAAGFAVTVTGVTGIDPAEAARSQAVVMAVAARTLGSAQAVCRRWPW